MSCDIAAINTPQNNFILVKFKIINTTGRSFAKPEDYYGVRGSNYQKSLYKWRSYAPGAKYTTISSVWTFALT